jgi:hypothetical protein
MPIKEIFAEEQVKEIMRLYTSGTKEELRLAIQDIVLPLKRFIENQRWDGQHITIIEDNAIYDEEQYGTITVKVIQIACQVDSNKANSIMEAIAEVNTLLAKELHGTCKIYAILIPINPEDF